VLQSLSDRSHVLASYRLIETVDKKDSTINFTNSGPAFKRSAGSHSPMATTDLD
jgi:hypothetical protein